MSQSFSQAVPVNELHAKVINDNIHGHFAVSQLAIEIIDTPPFQRLRRLKQLGTISYVFPGAEHTRFQHSLGVYHLARRQMEIIRAKQPELEISDRDVEIVSIAGLCHDLGHGPFSHAFEEWVNRHNKSHPSQPNHFEHEEMSLKILRRIIDQHDIDIADDEFDMICCMISHSCEMSKKVAAKVHAMIPPSKQFMLDIVSNSLNSIDVDKFDYLVRDSYNSGKPCGFDPERLMSTCMVIDGVLCFQEKEVYNIYELFRTRYSMFRQVYLHKVSKAIEYMVSDIMTLADPVLQISSSIHDAKSYLRLTDDILANVRYSNSDHPGVRQAKRLLYRLETRDIYRCVFEVMYTGDVDDRDAMNPPTAAEVTDEIMKELHGTIGGAGSNINVSENDFRVQIMKLNYAMGSADPVESVLFYGKATPESQASELPPKAYRIPRDRVSSMLPTVFVEFYIRVFVHDPRERPLRKAIQRAAQAWWEGKAQNSRKRARHSS